MTATVAILLAMATPLSLVVAYLFFLVRERPFLNKPMGGQAAKSGSASASGAAARTAGVAPTA